MLLCRLMLQRITRTADKISIGKNVSEHIETLTKFFCSIASAGSARPRAPSPKTWPSRNVWIITTTLHCQCFMLDFFFNVNFLLVDLYRNLCFNITKNAQNAKRKLKMYLNSSRPGLRCRRHKGVANNS